MFPAEVYKIMIGSPSDVKEEIQLVIQSIYDWDNTFSEKEKVVLLPSHWTINTYPAIGDEPQALINDQTTKYCDLMVAIFNARSGTPTKKHQSGTVEEIAIHRKNGKQVMVFFNANPEIADQKEYTRLRNYQDSIRGLTYYFEYSNHTEFEEKFKRALQNYLNDDWLRDKPKQKAIHASDTYLEFVSKSLSVECGTTSNMAFNSDNFEAREFRVLDSDIACIDDIKDGVVTIKGSHVGSTSLIATHKDTKVQCHIVVSPTENFGGNPVLDFNMGLTVLKDKAATTINEFDDSCLINEGNICHAYHFTDEKLSSVVSVIDTLGLGFNDVYPDISSYLQERFSFVKSTSDGQWFRHKKGFFALSINGIDKGYWIIIYSNQSSEIKRLAKIWREKLKGLPQAH